MDKFRVYSDIASICLEIGGNFFPVPNEIGSDGLFNVVVVDAKTDGVKGKLGIEWQFYNTLQINQDNCYLHSSDCARLDESGGLPSHHERLYQYEYRISTLCFYMVCFSMFNYMKGNEYE